MPDDAHTHPADLNPAALDGQHMLVLGAPYVGKSHRFHERNPTTLLYAP